ncbi:hypothetical protein GH714_015563 [Hevea brasiliensis]|uniref:Uncharacterized protein n=1 Tax=Hevea brasiliensis TaxID=3981 RepID=A0A6A6MF55_HEVBR|nr:hypothetical protein GH714_015563 [Hevea brasiliensis]
MLPGPPSRNNFGSIDLSSSGLLAFPSGSSISVVDSRSLQLISTIPLPPPSSPSSNSSSSLSPFITSIRWTPLPLHRDLLSTEPSSHLLLAAADRHGRIALLDFRLKSVLLWFDQDPNPKCGIQDLCWVLGETEDDVAIKELHIPADCSELLRLERDAAGGSSSSAPASAVYPLYCVKFAFSPQWRHIIFVTFPESWWCSICSTRRPFLARHCHEGGKFLDVLPDPNNELLYCAHLDGRLSIWRRKEGEQVHVMCTMEEMMPSIGSSVPSPSVLAVTICQSESTLQNVAKLYSDAPNAPLADMDFDNPFDFCDDTLLLSKTHVISISDDGKIWNWLLTAEGIGDTQKDVTDLGIVSDSCEVPVLGANGNGLASADGLASEASKQQENMGVNKSRPSSILSQASISCKSGTVDIVDVSANAVAASFSVHNGTVRGLRWLGILDWFHFLTIRSGLNRPFRVLQKPERAPIRALRTSSSGRYLLILFRDAPVEVWAMTKSPIMLRSLALPFTVLEWTLPTVPRTVQNGPSRQFSWSSKDQQPVDSDAASTPKAASSESTAASSDASQDDTAESFAFALVNGALGVFEVHGRRIRDFRPKWPSSSFVSSDGLITAMAYRLPHVAVTLLLFRLWETGQGTYDGGMTTGHSSSFNTHREGIRRIKFSPIVPGDRSRGRIAVLFYDNTFSVFDLNLKFPHLPVHFFFFFFLGSGTGNDKKPGYGLRPRATKERFRPMPICSPILFPTPHALALRMILQLGVKPSWFNTCGTAIDKRPHSIPGTASPAADLRSYMIDLPAVGDSVVPEMLLKVLEPYRKEGCILDDERARLYATIVNKGCAVRFAFAAAIFGETSEALFWLQLPHALKHLINKLVNKSPQKVPISASMLEIDGTAMLNRIASKGKSVTGTENRDLLSSGQLRLMAFQQEELWESANERIPWHEKLEGEEAIQNHVHELVSVGNLEAAVSLLLSTSPDSSYFYANALRAVALSSAVSRSLHELAVKVVAANMVRTDRSLSGTHLLCAVGSLSSNSAAFRYFSIQLNPPKFVVGLPILTHSLLQLQDAGCWTDAATLAATHLKGSDYARVLQRWAEHVLRSEYNIWRALILFVAAGALQEALAALREAQQPDTAAMFILACREIHGEIIGHLRNSDDESGSSDNNVLINLPGLNPENEDVIAVGEYFGQYQRKLVHLCMDAQPFSD